jgi:RHS repeat-associated protein
MSFTKIAPNIVYNGANITLTFDGVGNLTHRYLYGSVRDQVLADETSSGQILWALSDNQGSVRDIVDSTGSGLNHITYDSFGKVVSETDPTTEFRFGYTGRDRDEETGLDYYRSRYYNPAIGRFISEDPIEFAGGDSNLYRYVGNSPSTATDPSGLFLETLVRPVATAVGGAAQATGLGLLGTLAIGAIGLVGGVLLYQEPLGDTEDEMLRRARQRATPPGTGIGTRSRNPNLPSPGSPTRNQPQPQPTPSAPANPNHCPPRRRRPCDGELQGGSYYRVKLSNSRSGAEIHHMPSWGATENSTIELGSVRGGKGKGPAVCMTPSDHADTRSYRGRNARYMPIQIPLINAGRYLEAQALDIVELQTKFPGKYDVGIAEMLDYTVDLMSTQPNLFR